MSAKQTISFAPAKVGLVLGLVLGLSPLANSSVLSSKALWTLGLGLGFTYASIGVLVAVLPPLGFFVKALHSRGVGFLWGAAIGAAYSLPGAFFTMVPYPLAADAPSYWQEFADGGIRAWLLTLGFGSLIGGICGLFRKVRTDPTKTHHTTLP